MGVTCVYCKDGADLLPGESCGDCKQRRATVTEVCRSLQDLPEMAVEPEVTLTIDEADALREALEAYMRHDDMQAGNYRAYKDRWNAADIALVPLRGGPMSAENRKMEPPLSAPPWSNR